MRLVFFISASLLGACSEPAPPKPPPAPSIAFYQEYVVTEQPPGFRLLKQIDPARADPKRFFWRATYDSEGRVVSLDTFAYPMCLQSQLSLTYAGKEVVPAKRQRVPAHDCKPAKTF